MTLAATVRAAARRFGPRPAMVDPDGSVLSYAALDERSDAVALGLAADGLTVGEPVTPSSPRSRSCPAPTR